MMDLKVLLVLNRKPWRHRTTALHGMTKADIKRKPLFRISDQTFIFLLLKCKKTID